MARRPACRGATVVLVCAAIVLVGAVAGAVPGTVHQAAMPVPPSWSHPHPNVAYASIACHAVGECTAIGVHTDSTGAYLPAADTERHGKWEPPTTIALPSGAQPTTFGLGFRSIACPVQGACVAVGTYWDPTAGRGFEPMLAVQTDGVWGAATSDVPLPAGATMAELDAVWCKHAGECAATGVAWTSETSDGHAFVDVESDAVWHTSVTLPDPNIDGLKAPTEVSPSSITCTKPTSCVVVGVATGAAQSGPQLGFAEVEHASGWSAHVFYYSQANGTVIDLTSVACPSSTTCLAVGSAGATAAYIRPFVATYAHGKWDAGRYFRAHYYAPATHGGQLDGISCPTAHRCVTVGQLDGIGAGTSGSSGELAIAYTWTSGHWSSPALVGAPATSSSRSAGAQLAAIACPSAGACETTGTTTPVAASLKGVYPYASVVAPVSGGRRPGAPSRLAAVAATGSFSVSWRGPTSFGGSPIQAFTVVAQASHEPIVSCVTPELNCTLSGIATGHHYVVDVTAQNGAMRLGPTARLSVNG